MQYYETGVTGNPRSRVIITEDKLNAGLRKFKTIQLNGYDTIEFISLSTLRANCESIPKTIIYNNKTFKLILCNAK
ncbi:MAG: hypothetical protein ABL940_06245 [Bacteroidia bacterium]